MQLHEFARLLFFKLDLIVGSFLYNNFLFKKITKNKNLTLNYSFFTVFKVISFVCLKMFCFIYFVLCYFFNQTAEQINANNKTTNCITKTKNSKVKLNSRIKLKKIVLNLCYKLLNYVIIFKHFLIVDLSNDAMEMFFLFDMSSHNHHDLNCKS